ncbi:MAG TPA: malate/lactate/ureidoglycolate dehydrogenase [Paraburkholderia sp.]|jgi:uncharacterized oxidoreductase|nr:malate/lactate/ureidoglycolate dehydrogenase [Paraburkholderia sp.]
MEDQRSAKTGMSRVAPDHLHAYVKAIWERAGSMPREAELVADHLVASSLSGHDSHGIGMIPRYAASLHANELKLNRHASVVSDVGAVLTIDGGLGFGQVVAHEAMELGIERARRMGVCAVGLRNAHHIGRIGHWAEQCADAGFVSFHFVNVAGDPLVAPFGGMDRRIGTNPFCAAFPRDGGPPLVLDFATSAIAYGKTRVAYNQRKPVPEGALIDHDGRPTVDPAVMQVPPHGSLLPTGGATSGHKGYGLAVMCELFGGALSGGHTTHETTLEKTPKIVNGMLSVIVDPRAFDAMDAQREADAFIEWVKASPMADGVAQIQMPGEPERRNRVDRETNGVPVDAQTWRQIRDAARSLGMSEEEAARWADV